VVLGHGSVCHLLEKRVDEEHEAVHIAHPSAGSNAKSAPQSAMLLDIG